MARTSSPTALSLCYNRLMNAELFLSQTFATAVRFKDHSGTSAPRPVLVVSVENNLLTVLIQGLFAVESYVWTPEQLMAKAWPDLEMSYFAAAAGIASAVKMWLPCSRENMPLVELAVSIGSEMTTKPKAAKPTEGFPAVYTDYSRRTCIVIARKGKRVSCVQMAEGAPFELADIDDSVFDRRYTKRLDDYPVARAAKLYVSFAVVLGGSAEALEELGRITPISNKELEMAAAKKAASAAEKPAPAAKKSVKAVATPAPAAKKAAAKSAPVKAEKPAKAEKDSAPRETAAAMFQELLALGKHTDAVIFEKVQAKFGLDDKKRSYVGWYRNYMRKQGLEVADPI